MHFKRTRSLCLSMMVLAAGLAPLRIAQASSAAPSPASGELAEKFTLIRAIPDNVFFAVNGRHNPERKFLDSYWGEVWAEFERSGIMKDTLDLIFTHLSEKDKAEAQRLIDRFSKLLSEIDCGAMCSGEIAFAERMPKAKVDGDDISVGAPDYVVLFRTDGKSAAELFKQVAALMDAAVEEINEAAKANLRIERREQGEVKLAEFNLTQSARGAIPLPLSLWVRKDVLGFSFGTGLRDEVLELLEGGSGRTVADDPRFKADLAKLPPAEDSVMFFDMANLRDSLRHIAHPILKTVKETADDRIENARENEEANALNRDGLAKYEAGEPKAALELFRQAHEIAPKDSVVLYNMACMNALIGEREKSLDWLEKAVEGGFYSPGKIMEDSDLESLRDEARFKAAVEQARKLAGKESREGAAIAERVVNRLLDSMGIIDHVTAIEYTEGYATFAESLAMMPKNAEKNPLYPVVMGGAPVKDFSKYLPKETTSFSVNGGFALDALYKFIEDTFHEAGEPGKAAWGQWNEMQKEYGFDVRKDLISWIEGSGVSASFEQDGAEAWVYMMRVKDQAVSREKLDEALKAVPEMMSGLASQNPALGMLQIRVEPTDSEMLKGFHNIYIAISPEPMVCGLRDDWMIAGSSQRAVQLVLATAAGEHPNVRENARIMAEAVLPKGPAEAVSFQDHRNDIEQLAAFIGGLSMAGGMAASFIPDEQARETVVKVFHIASKLSPVVAKMDFYRSTASCTQREGEGWRSKTVTHYVAPEHRGHESEETGEKP